MRQILVRINRDGERWLLLIFYTMIVATIAIEVLASLWLGLFLDLGRGNRPLCIYLSGLDRCRCGRS